VIQSDELSSFTLSHLEDTESGMPGCKSEAWGRFGDGLGSNIIVFLWIRYYPPWLNYCKGICGQVG
jgi:hypothetical protein